MRGGGTKETESEWPVREEDYQEGVPSIRSRERSLNSAWSKTPFLKHVGGELNV